ncbi:hypothetical protein ACIA49_37280 [Kribbella sp. NPDC051587]|uniref:hypothetical protein n=1 Tax=Kribbella sp. NPDC051587 TaxID=3364119 RepID=UPI00379462F3
MRESSTADRRSTAVGWCDEHGGALHSLALDLVRDPSEAQAVVTSSICAAAARPGAGRQSSGVRQELARQVYLRCACALAAKGDNGPRQVISLVRHGRLDYRQVAELTGFSAATVASLLSKGLRDEAQGLTVS